MIANEPDLGAVELELEASIYRDSYADFIRVAWHIHEPSTPLLWAWPYQVVADHLQAIVEDWAARKRSPQHIQRLKSLLFTLPPGTLKSRLLALLVPWAWLRWPHMRVLCFSGNPNVVKRDSVISRDVIADAWYQRTFRPTWSVRGDIDAKGMYENNAGGWRAAKGFEAGTIGERGDLIIVDDPHDPEEVESEAQRTAVHKRWEDTLHNRVNDLAISIRVGIAQRTHTDDWSARRIAEGWAHVDLPMLYETDRACETPLGKPDPRTVEGECLHPERFPPDIIAEERARPGGERRFATLYQGRPSPRGGAIVKLADLRFWRHDADPQVAARPEGCYTGPARVPPTRFDAIVLAGDLAGGLLTLKGDFNALVVVARAGANFFLLEYWVKRAGFPEVQEKVRELARRYPFAKKIIETAASGASLVASLEQEISGLVGQVAKGDKESRLESVLSVFEAGNVHLPDGAPGLDPLIAQLAAFPNAPHDDFVDAMSLAIVNIIGPTTSNRDRWRALAGDDSDEVIAARVARAAEQDEQTRIKAAKRADRMRELDERARRGEKLNFVDRYQLKQWRAKQASRQTEPARSDA